MRAESDRQSLLHTDMMFRLPPPTPILTVFVYISKNIYYFSFITLPPYIVYLHILYNLYVPVRYNIRRFHCIRGSNIATAA